MFAAVVSVIALVFAAIAAWAAMRTVQLTRQMQIEGRVQRLSEALVQVMEAARQAPDAPGAVITPASQQLIDALSNLRIRAPSTAAALSDSTTDLVDLLLNKYDAWRTPKPVVMAAFQAHRELTKETAEVINPPRLRDRLPGLAKP